jgi:hypothetical protein
MSTYIEKPDSDQVKILQAYQAIPGWSRSMPWPYGPEALRLALAQERARHNRQQARYEAAYGKSGDDA